MLQTGGSFSIWKTGPPMPVRPGAMLRTRLSKKGARYGQILSHRPRFSANRSCRDGDWCGNSAGAANSNKSPRCAEVSSKPIAPRITEKLALSTLAQADSMNHNGCRSFARTEFMR